jgi:diketogulonate reductase-like aldo/keto reductase
MSLFNVSTAIGVGFGTAALGSQNYEVTTMALEEGFRKFDTAEADW